MTALGVFMINDPKSTNSSAANIGYESKLWKTADTLRGSMDAGLRYFHHRLEATGISKSNTSFDMECQDD